MKKMTVLILVGMVSVSCSGSDVAENVIESQDGVGDVNIDVDEDTGEVDITIQSEDGDGSITIGGGELPDDFQWDLPDGGEIQTVSTSTQGNLVALRYPADQYDALVDLFQGIYDSEGSINGSITDLSDPPIKGFAWETSSGGFVTMSVSMQGDQTIVQIIYGDS